MTALLLGLGLLAMFAFAVWRTWRELRRQRAYLRRVEERKARAWEDIYWMLYRDIEAKRARDIWRREWSERMAISGVGLGQAFKTLGVSSQRTAALILRLAALLEADTIEQQAGI